MQSGLARTHWSFILDAVYVAVLVIQRKYTPDATFTKEWDGRRSELPSECQTSRWNLPRPRQDNLEDRLLSYWKCLCYLLALCSEFRLMLLGSYQSLMRRLTGGRATSLISGV